MRENYISSAGLLQVSAYTLIYLVIKPEQNVVLKVTLHLFQDTNIYKWCANRDVSGVERGVRRPCPVDRKLKLDKIKSTKTQCTMKPKFR